MESITGSFFTLDRDWRFTYLNHRAQPLVQRRREKLLGRRLWEEFPGLLGTELEAAYRRAMTNDVTVALDEYHYPPLDAWFQIDLSPSEQGLAVYFRDVSEQHRAQQALQERVEELRALATISGGAQRLTDPEQLCELTADSLVAAMHHPDQVEAQVTLAEAVCRLGFVRPGSSTLAVPIMVEDEKRGQILFGAPTALLPEEESFARAVAKTLGSWLGSHRATSELTQAHAQREGVAQLEDDLLSMASHELRTPLTPILGFVELLERRGHDLGEAQRRMLQVVHGNARRMLGLVDDLLVVSRATAGARVSHPEQVLAQEVLQPVLDELTDALPGVDISLGRVELMRSVARKLPGRRSERRARVV